ncbi:MAG: peptidylprolyl isomerase [Deltaproteobacteria bacterium]|nr:peptidylprolyl isomerase [Deltaproteobacteria bacterium]
MRGIGVWICLLLLFLAFSARGEAEGKGERKVAVVNDAVIGVDEFNREMGIFREKYGDSIKFLKESEMRALKKKIIEGIIDRELLFQESQRAGIRIEDKAVEEQLAKIKKRYPSEEVFKGVLKRVNLTEEEVGFQIRKGLSIQRLISERFDKIVVSEEEARAFFDKNPQMFKEPEKVRASHILVKVGPGMDEAKKAEARKKIEKARERLSKGEDFAQVAREVSEGPSRTKGGDLGYFKRGQMVKPFEDASFAMKPGEVSGIVETRFGFHIIKVTERKPEKIVSFEEVKEKLREYLKSRKVQKGVDQLVASLKEKAKIERFIP